MHTKKLVGAAAFSAALAAGGVAGVFFGTPVLSGAQETDSSTTDDATTDAPERRMHIAGPKADLSTAAEALGMTEEALRTELQAGKSIADVAAEKGVDKQKVIDALVAAATARLDEMKTQLPERMADLVERDGLGRRPGGPGRGPGHHRGAGVINSIDDAATALGISRLELREALESGKSIAQVADEKGKDLDEVKAAMLADANARIDQAVENGRIDADKAAEMKAAFAQKIDAIVQQEGLPMRGPKGFGPGPAPEDAPEAENSSLETA